VKSWATCCQKKNVIRHCDRSRHGGKDPGARGGFRAITSFEKKDYCFIDGKECASRINAVDGFKAVLTRSTDNLFPFRGPFTSGALRQMPD